MTDSKRQPNLQSLDEIKVQVAERIREENELLPPPADTPNIQNVINSDMVRQCLENNERGDGILYSQLHRDQFVFVKKLQEWFKFSGHYWESDVYQEHLRVVEKVATTYLEQSDSLQPGIDRLNNKLVEQKYAVKSASNRVKEAERIIRSAIRAGNGISEAEQELDKVKIHDADISDQMRETSIQLQRLVIEQKAYHRRIDRLRSINGATKCAEWSHIVEYPLAITGDELDQQPWLLPCKNGIIDLRLGELRPGVPGDWLSKAIPIEYQGFDTPCPEWNKFLSSIQPDDKVRDFLAPLMGYSITGHSLEQFIAVFIGPGRNGKGLFFEILEMILGPFYWTIQSEMLLESKTLRSSAGASPDILALKGRRICAASETDQGRRISCARVKELTGSDTLNARLLYDKHDTNFRPTHTLFLRTNNVPDGLTKDFALRERLIYITFPYRFVDDPDAKAKEDPSNSKWYRKKDRGIKARLVTELPGILSWLIRGCAEWIYAGRLNPPASIRQAVEDLHTSEDHVGRFLTDCCELTDDPDYYESYNHIYIAFVRWYCEEECIDPDSKEGNRYVLSSKTVSKELKNKGYHSPNKATTGGKKRIYGLKLVQA